jgi:UDP-N-acetylenolpyruvoylglucosamine reductase
MKSSLVNDGSATATDVLSLIDVVKQRAKSARGIELETEVEIFGGRVAPARSCMCFERCA